MSTKAFFDASWAKFKDNASTRGVVKREFPEWHKGRKKYYVWVVDVNVETILARYEKMQAIFEDKLIADYDRVPHVTLFVSGFLQDVVIYDDDFDHDFLEEQKKKLNKVLQNGLQLSVGGVNSFVSSPYLEVYDADNKLNEIRKSLFSLYSNAHSPEVRMTSYLPHITLGLYSANYNSGDIADMLCEHRLQEPIALPVKSVSLVSYDAQVIGSVLKTVFSIQLT